MQLLNPHSPSPWSSSSTSNFSQDLSPILPVQTSSNITLVNHNRNAGILQATMTPTRIAPSPHTRSGPSQPTVSESAESGKRRRGRQATACRDCNRRKQKCDGLLPCTNCTKRGVGSRCSFPGANEGLHSVPTPDSGGAADPPSKRHKIHPSPTKISQVRIDDDESNGNDEDLNGFRSRAGLFSSSSSRSGIDEISYTRARHSPPPPPSHPISSERGQQVQQTTFRHPSPVRGREAETLFWKRARSLEREDAAVASGDSSRAWSDNEPALDDDGPSGVGKLYEYHPEEIDSERTFFGTSHFGPQLAARVIRGTPSVPLSDVRSGPKQTLMFSSETKPFTLAAQVRGLIRLLPRKSVCDHLCTQFFSRYNDHVDILYKDDFYTKYVKFWDRSFDLEAISSIDMRWLSLLLIVLAFGVLLDRDTSRDRQENVQEREEMSLSCFWGARKALVEAQSFYGESLDTVRAFALVSLYLIVCRRVPEAWTAVGDGIRSAQAQGLHIDGEKWRLPLKESEIRRRLWAQLYIIDRSISLFLGRPLAIHDDQCAVRSPVNVTDEDLSALSTALPVRPLSSPTKSTFLILHQKLAHVIGKFTISCFGLKPRAYNDVLEAEQLLQDWRRDLPPHFKLDDPESSLDVTCPWLKPQRHTLCSKFHLARIALHRPYLLRSFGGKGGSEYRASAEACVTSAIADITLRLSLNETDPLDRFKWMTVASGFSPATVIGILCARRHRDPRIDYAHLLSLLEGYISVERMTSRTDESLEAEINVLDLMVKQAKAINEESRQKVYRPRNASGTSNGMLSGTSNGSIGGGHPANVDYTMDTNGVNGVTFFSNDTQTPILPHYSNPLYQIPTYHTPIPSSHLNPHANANNSLSFLNNSQFNSNVPPIFPSYTDIGEEWMLPSGEGGISWAPAPDWDTTAAGLPDPGDGKGWQEVMQYVNVMNGISESPDGLLST